MSTFPVGNSGKKKYWSYLTAVTAVAAGACVLLVAGACGSSGSAATAGTTGATGTAPVTLRLGYFPNITHAPALVGVQEGIFAKALGPDRLDASKTFNAGPAETEAMLSGAIDVAFIGPSPSINAFTKSNGAVRVITGATSGGAALVVKPSITSVDQLKGKTIATPQLGNTQDVALRAFLKSKGFKTDTQGGGDVSIKPQDNSQTIDTFRQGLIDGAWVPEPYVSELVQDGGHVLVDERSLWPNGQWVTTDVLVRTSFLKAHPATISRFLTGLDQSIDQLKTDPTEAEAATNQQLQALTGKALPAKVLAASFSDLSFTVDPLASTFTKEASDAVSAGLLQAPKLNGIFDLTLLNQVLKSKGQPEVASS
jgi:NitT/TauT family transport system substrate-binding protein